MKRLIELIKGSLSRRKTMYIAIIPDDVEDFDKVTIIGFRDFKTAKEYKAFFPDALIKEVPIIPRNAYDVVAKIVFKP